MLNAQVAGLDQGDHLLHTPPPHRDALAHIPGEFGPPLIGRTFGWLQDMFALAEDYEQRFGPVSKLNIFGNDVLLVVGADNLQAAYLTSTDQISARLSPPNPLSPFYAGALLFSDGTVHRGNRRFMQHAFKASAMRHYVTRIDQIAAKHVQALTIGERRPVFPLMKRFLTEIAASIFFGLDDRDPMAETLMNDFVLLNQGLISLVRIETPIPGLRFPKAMRANRRIDAFIRSVIETRRAGDEGDVLSHLCRATDEAGDWISDDEIVRQAKFLFFAAHDTTSSSMTNMMMLTSQHPEWQNAMRDEIGNMLGTADITYDDLDSLSVLHQVMFETLRMYPTVPASPRIALEGCKLGGFDVPAGTPLAIITRTTHMDPTHWRDPALFDPTRFAEGREEHKAHSFQYAPFGGGPHKCIGMHFAIMVTKVFYSRLLRSLSYSLPSDYKVKMSVLPLPKPKDDLPILFERLS